MIWEESEPRNEKECQNIENSRPTLWWRRDVNKLLPFFNHWSSVGGIACSLQILKWLSESQTMELCNTRETGDQLRKRINSRVIGIIWQRDRRQHRLRTKRWILGHNGMKLDSQSKWIWTRRSFIESPDIARRRCSSPTGDLKKSPDHKRDWRQLAEVLLKCRKL
jgi:hypothetical protein